MSSKSPKEILRKLVERWQYYSLVSSNRVKTADGRYRPAGKPGETIERLSEEDREILKELKAKDIEKDNYPFRLS